MIHQTKSAVQIAIINALVELGRPANAEDVASWLFNHSRVDGTRASVFRTVKFEMFRMYEDDIIDASWRWRYGRARDTERVTERVYTLHDLLTTIAMITNN